MKTSSRIARSIPQDESPLRHLPLVDLLVDTRTELFELAMRSGLKVFTTMLEEDRTALCGPRYAHEPDRPASRAGTVRSEVVLSGRKVAIQRPRVRTADGEVALPTFQTMAITTRWLDGSSNSCWSAWPHASTRAAWNRSPPTSRAGAPARAR